MTRKIAFAMGVTAGLLLVAGMPVHAAQIVVTLGSQYLGVHSPAGDTLGDYYTLALPVPEAIVGKEFFGAYLEIYLDVDAREIDEVVNDTPCFDVFALTETLGEGFDEETFGIPALGPGHVLLGENRRVLRDVSDIVRSYLDDPDSNHGLILGSLRGVRDGLFAVKTGVVEQGVVARLIIHYRDR